MHVFLERSAAAYPDRVALRFEDQVYTYAELLGRARAIARVLSAQGIGLGSRVAPAAANSADWIAAHFAISMAGAATVLVNSSWRETELAHAFDLTRPDAILADETIAAQLVGTPSRVAPIQICVEGDPPAGWHRLEDLVVSAPLVALPSFEGLDLGQVEALLPFSSGTTGMPKAVRHSHRGMVIAGETRVVDYGVTADDRLLYFMPLFTIYGVSAVLSVFGAGASMWLFRRFDPEVTLRTIEEERITLAFAGGPIAVAIRALPDHIHHDCSSLRYMMWGATPILPDVAEDVTRRFGIRWFPGYGATETLIAMSPIDEPETWRLDSPGIPISGVHVKVVDLETGVELPDGETGELVVRFDGMMMGYLPEE